MSDDQKTRDEDQEKTFDRVFRKVLEPGFLEKLIERMESEDLVGDDGPAEGAE